jgi:hypothetical protein
MGITVGQSGSDSEFPDFFKKENSDLSGNACGAT